MSRPRRGRARGAGPLPVPAAVAGLTAIGVIVAILAANLFATAPKPAPVTESGPGGHDVPATSAGPDIHFATTGVDFGHVPLGKEVGYAFSFANVGDAPLRVQDVRVRVLEGC